MKKSFNIFLILSICLFLLTGCTKNEPTTLKEKNIAELEYIETNLVGIVNKMVREEYKDDQNNSKEMSTNTSDESGNETDERDMNIITELPIENKSLNWEKIMQDTKKIEESVATTLVDLASLNIEAGEIAKLSNGVNNMIVAVENKDESSYLIELNNVYSLIPTYMEKYSARK